MQTLMRDNITHLMVFLPILEKWAGDNLDGEEMDVMESFFGRHTRLLCFHEGYGLFAVGGGACSMSE